jgi:peptidyl-prolyl cis-trans isomerase B (cyclophilin B)
MAVMAAKSVPVAPYSARAMPGRLAPLFAVVIALLLTGCGSDAAPPTSPAPGSVTSPDYLAFRRQPTACGAEAPAAATAMSFAAPGDAAVGGPIEVVLHTSCGPVRLRLDPVAAPETVNSFIFLARQGYFDGTVSHRVLPGFVFQAGDPTAGGGGSPGYTIPDELPPPDFAYTRGVVAMANTGAPDSGGSQFFIVLADTTLPPTYTVFGEVTAGLEVLDRIAALPLGPNPPDPRDSRPLQTVYLERVEVVGG